MADTKTQFSEEELGHIRNLLSPFDGDATGPAFSPMAEQFQADLEAVKSVLEPEPEPPVGTIPPLPTDDEEPSFMTDGLPPDESFGLDMGGPADPPGESADEGGDFEYIDTPAEPDSASDSAPAADEFAFPDMGNDDALAADSDASSLEPLDSSPLEASSLDDLGAGFDTGADSSLEPDEGAESAPDASLDFDLGADIGALSTDAGLDEPAADTGGFESGDSSFDLSDIPAEATAEPLDDAGGLDFGTPESDLDLGGDLGGDLTPEPSMAGGTESSDDLGGLDFDLGSPAGPSTDAGADLDLDAGGLDLSPAPTAVAEAAPEDELGLDFGGLGDFTTDLGESSGAEASAEPALDLGAGAGDDLGGDLGSIADSGELAAMTEQSQMDQGIGDEFTDEELARIRTNLNDYPPGVRKSAIDAIVNEKISRSDQRLLVNMIGDQAQPESIGDFLESRLGYRPDVAPSTIRKDGIQIIYTDQVSPEDMAAKRKRAKLVIVGAAAGILGIALLFAGIYFYKTFFVRGMYERGLEELARARDVAGDEREEHRKRAEEFFQKAKDADGGVYSVDYLNRYGIAYMKAGYYEDAFVKLYGKVKPDYGEESGESAWNREGQRAPLVRMADGSAFPSPRDAERKAVLTARDNVKRTVEIPGAYLVSRLRDGNFERQNVMALARFHSNHAGSFLRKPEGQKYKNDALAIDYYRLVLTLMNKPDDAEAMAGIGGVHYQQKAFGAAAREYNKILDRHPMEVSGHAGLLNTYMEIWRADGDPRLVIARHRLIRAHGLEDKLPIYILAKLAGFYTELDHDDVRIKYQVDPVDAVSGLDLKDNAATVLEVPLSRKEKRDEDVVEGSKYGEGFYRRGMFLLAQKESQRALRQFQNAHQFDSRHYLAVNAMGEYYKSVKDYGKAEQYFSEAVKTYKRHHEDYGGRIEDETLEQGDHGKLYYNLGSLVFLRYAGLPEESSEGFRDTRIYPDRALRAESPEMRQRREQLTGSRSYFETALEEGLKDETARIQSSYWMGWIDYANADFTGALERWESLESRHSYSDPVLLMAKANAYYYTDQTRAALGSYLKVQSDSEREAMTIGRPDPSNSKHRRLYITLAAVYNNMGAIYEREYKESIRRGLPRTTLAGLERNALLQYWHAVDASRKVELDNEIARSNIQLSFKPGDPTAKEREPLLDDWVSPVLATLDPEKKRH